MPFWLISKLEPTVPKLKRLVVGVLGLEKLLSLLYLHIIETR
jgi:hypothetical protein